MKLTQAAIDLVRQFEGLGDGDKAQPGLQPYLCPAGYWTIGYGRVLRGTDGRMLKGEADRAAALAIYPNGITEAQAAAILERDLTKVGDQVSQRLTGAVTDDQFGAVVSFVYNVGIGAFESSTLRRMLNAGDVAGAADQFLVWDKMTDPKTGSRHRRDEKPR